MLPTLRKFFRLVAPKLIGETRDGDAHDGSGFKSPSKLGAPRSHHRERFWSLPAMARRLARISMRRDDYAYHLATIEGGVNRQNEQAVCESGRNAHGNTNAHDDTRAVAGRDVSLRSQNRVGEESSKSASVGNLRARETRSRA